MTLAERFEEKKTELLGSVDTQGLSKTEILALKELLGKQLVDKWAGASYWRHLEVYPESPPEEAYNAALDILETNLRLTKIVAESFFVIDSQIWHEPRIKQLLYGVKLLSKVCEDPEKVAEQVTCDFENKDIKKKIFQIYYSRVFSSVYEGLRASDINPDIHLATRNVLFDQHLALDYTKTVWQEAKNNRFGRQYGIHLHIGLENSIAHLLHPENQPKADPHESYGDYLNFLAEVAEANYHGEIARKSKQQEEYKDNERMLKHLCEREILTIDERLEPFAHLLS